MKELTDRFTTDLEKQRKVALRGDAAFVAFQALRAGLGDDLVVVAHWLKSRGGESSRVIPNGETLGYILEGVLRHRCRDLRFRAEPASDHRLSVHRTYQDLFCR